MNDGVGAPRLVHLDALRGLAALVVVIGHIRGFVLVDYAESGSRGLFNQGLYFVTGLGHGAVLCFFALSGFLVGGSAFRAMRNGKWSWSGYLVARLSRLWTVAIPALLITWLIDSAAIRITGPAGYDGSFWTQLSSGPRPDAPASLGPATFVGNVFFLQTIFVPVLGSNGPLWSLANEFWYYVTIPMLVWASIDKGWWLARVAVGTGALLLLVLLPRDMAILGLIWFGGALAGASSGQERLKRIVSRPGYRSAAIVAVMCALVAGFKAPSLGIWNDLLQGVAWIAMLPALVHLAPPGGWFGNIYRRLAMALSEISYTLYAVHFPVLAAAYFSLMAPDQLQPGFLAAGVVLAQLILAIAIATLIWWLFERNTARVRTVMTRSVQKCNRAWGRRGAP